MRTRMRSDVFLSYPRLPEFLRTVETVTPRTQGSRPYEQPFRADAVEQSRTHFNGKLGWVNVVSPGLCFQSGLNLNRDR